MCFPRLIKAKRVYIMASADTILAMKGMAADPLKRKLLLKVYIL